MRIFTEMLVFRSVRMCPRCDTALKFEKSGAKITNATAGSYSVGVATNKKSVLFMSSNFGS